MAAVKDNSTWQHKARLRRMVLDACSDPVVMETHGGWGKLFTEVWHKVPRGVVFEKDEAKSEVLARQRPTWSVYNSTCEKAIAGGAGAHLKFNIFDIDPYGSPFEVIESIFKPERELPDVVHVVVNDGLRQKVQLGGAWSVECLQEIVRDFGNDLYEPYLDVAKEKTRRLVKGAGYELANWFGYHCGHAGGMTHYWATLKRVT